MSKDETKPKAKAKPKEKTLHEKLVDIQAKLVAPKDQKSKMYSYRKAEDILEAVKKIANPLGVSVCCQDEIIKVGDRYYVKATATISMGEQTDKGMLGLCSYGFSREEESSRNMNQSQLTGSASSYARKIALGGLFALDNNNDPDTPEYNAKQPKTPQDATQTTNSQGVRVAPAETEETPHYEAYDDGKMPIDNMFYVSARNSIKDLCQRYKVEPGAGTAWIQGQYKGKTLEDMKDDDQIMLKVMQRFTDEFIPAYVAERKLVNERLNKEEQP